MQRIFVVPGLLMSFSLLSQIGLCEDILGSKATAVAEQLKPREAGASAKPLTPNAKPSRLAIGEKAPDFRLNDQDGNERTLKELLAKSKVALVFFRSADW